MTIWPQITWIALCAADVAINLVQHGKPRTGRYNIIGSVIGAGLMIWILHSGGFFAPLVGL